MTARFNAADWCRRAITIGLEPTLFYQPNAVSLSMNAGCDDADIVEHDRLMWALNGAPDRDRRRARVARQLDRMDRVWPPRQPTAGGAS